MYDSAYRCLPLHNALMFSAIFLYSLHQMLPGVSCLLLTYARPCFFLRAVSCCVGNFSRQFFTIARILVQESDNFASDQGTESFNANNFTLLIFSIIAARYVFSAIHFNLIQCSKNKHDRIDENMDDTLANVEGAQGQLLKYLNSISSNRWLMIKIFFVLMVFLMIFLFFVA